MLLIENREEFEKLWYQVDDFCQFLTQSKEKLDFTLILSQETWEGFFFQLYFIAQEAQISHEFCTNYLLKYLCSKTKNEDRDEYASVVLEFLKEQFSNQHFV